MTANAVNYFIKGDCLYREQHCAIDDLQHIEEDVCLNILILIREL